MAKKKFVGKAFIEEFVLGFGFLSGVWVKIGIDPTSEVIKFLGNIFQQYVQNSSFTFVFWAIPFLIMAGSLWGAFKVGGLLGILAVVAGFFAGMLLGGSMWLILLIVAVVLGFIAPYVKNAK